MVSEGNEVGSTRYIYREVDLTWAGENFGEIRNVAPLNIFHGISDRVTRS